MTISAADDCEVRSANIALCWSWAPRQPLQLPRRQERRLRNRPARSAPRPGGDQPHRRLGIYNPDPYGTPFSIRGELFDIRTDAATTGDDDAWKQALEMTKKADLTADPDVAKYRKHQAFRSVSDPAFVYSSLHTEFTNSRLIARSVWNNRWKTVIPAYTLRSDEHDWMNRFINSVEDILLFLRTYSQSGN